MLDLQLFRDNPDLIRESEKRRFKDPAKVDEVIHLDNLWREKRKEADDLIKKSKENCRS